MLARFLESCVVVVGRLGGCCDEINLPANDAYGTQRVISFLRQLTEQGGFWRAAGRGAGGGGGGGGSGGGKDGKKGGDGEGAGGGVWVATERIQFVGACNPPTDPGRVPMSLRFLRHAPARLVQKTLSTLTHSREHCEWDRCMSRTAV